RGPGRSACLPNDQPRRARRPRTGNVAGGVDLLVVPYFSNSTSQLHFSTSRLELRSASTHFGLTLSKVIYGTGLGKLRWYRLQNERVTAFLAPESIGYGFSMTLPNIWLFARYS